MCCLLSLNGQVVTASYHEVWRGGVGLGRVVEWQGVVSGGMVVWCDQWSDMAWLRGMIWCLVGEDREINLVREVE